jgi:hypothetical protein
MLLSKARESIKLANDSKKVIKMLNKENELLKIEKNKAEESLKSYKLK